MRNQISTAQAVVIVVVCSTALAAAVLPLSSGLAILAWPFAVIMLLPSIWLVDRQKNTGKPAQKEEARQSKAA